MSIINFRITNGLKGKMEKMTHINWSEEMRKTVEQIIETEDKKNIAFVVLLNEHNIIAPDKNWSSTDEIRK